MSNPNYNWDKFDKKHGDLIQKMGEANPGNGPSMMAARGMLIAVVTGQSTRYQLPENTSVGKILMVIDDYTLVMSGKHDEIVL